MLNPIRNFNSFTKIYEFPFIFESRELEINLVNQTYVFRSKSTLQVENTTLQLGSDE